MKQKEKIEELEKRIRELEARPVYVPIYVGSPQPSYPCPQPDPWYRHPWYTSPTWRWNGVGQGTVTTAGSASVSSHLVKFDGSEQVSFTN